ncbi:kinesin-domain-containing protein [Obba rivulosa]|uniref:Kinesin-like protein n=1 Tax=Obba rivulosa TaxID=1052685 RepID=A0A8E2DGY9_9APHY|nr:kinesin-domain-containing protein [Obba rivulosa]
MATAHSKIKVATRIRPILQGEQTDGGIQVVRDGSERSHMSVRNPRDPSQVFTFPFASCYDEASTQEEIFERDIQPMLDAVYNGIAVTIFAYGVTSSGKTHTMQGSAAQPGITPRAVEALLGRRSLMEDRDVSLSVSYMEIYKDDVYDLLVPKEKAVKLPVRENEVGEVFVANLSSEPVNTVAEFDAMYSRASKQRSVGATNLNRASSRSHAIVTVTVESVDRRSRQEMIGKLLLVDLAGSENNKHTGNDASRMAESAAINKSLSVLGQVVHALNTGASRIPYRNSKLTRILQAALGGNSLGLLICNLAPGTKFRQDTLNTLNFASRTKNIENKPTVNQQKSDAVTATKSGIPAPSAENDSLQRHDRPPRTSIGYFKKLRVSNVPAANPPELQPQPKINNEQHNSSSSSTGPVAATLTEDEINARIAKAVEAEVARRLAEFEHHRSPPLTEQRDEEHRGHPPKASASGSPRISPRKHRSLDIELKQRLGEIEDKYERGSKESQTSSSLTPASRKKTGRAYVALARAQSEKNNLQLALELYRKAETYVPDNVKLKERIIEIEWAVKQDTPFNPSPKRAKKPKKTKPHRRADDAASDSQTLVGGSGTYSDVTENKENFLDAAQYPPAKRQILDETDGLARKRHKAAGLIRKDWD